MKTMKKAIVSMMLMFAAGVAIVGISAGPASAGVITWGAVQDVNFADPTQVSTNGAPFDSATNWSSDLTVNGVTFNHTLSSANPFTYANGSNIVVAFTAAYLSTSNPQTADYEKLLATSQYSGASGTITIGGLTSGSDYEVQVWSGNWNTTYTTKFDGILLHTGNNSGTAPNGTKIRGLTRVAEFRS